MVRLTKIIATLGPASGTKNGIKGLVRSGVDLFRLNLSHGKHEEVRQWIEWVREVEKRVGPLRRRAARSAGAQDPRGNVRRAVPSTCTKASGW